jgi:PAS domain S-box-containing protein
MKCRYILTNLSSNDPPCLLSSIPVTNKMMLLENKYKFIIENINDIITLIDVNGVIQYESPSVYKVLGYSPEKRIGQNCLDFVHTDDMDRLIGRMAKHALDDIDPEPEIFRFRHANGSWHYLEVNCVNKLKEESVKAFIVVSRDVTQRVEAEQLLFLSEQRYKSLFDHNPDAVYSFNKEGVFVSANSKTSELTGYPNESILNLNFRKIIHPDYLEATENHFKQALQGVPQHYKTCIFNKSRDVIHLHVTNIPIIVNGEITGVYGIAKDITYKLQAEQELKLSEQRYRSLFEQNTSPVCALDLAGKITEVNKAMVDLTGYDEPALKTMFFTDLLYPDQSAAYQICFDLSTYGKPVQFETDIITARGKRHILKLNNIPIITNEVLVGYYCIAVDVTEKYRLENEKKILAKASQTFTASDLLGEALVKILRLIGEFIGADMAEAWLPSFDRQLLRQEAWWSKKNGFDSFFAGRKNLPYRKGEGLVGKSWKSFDIIWLNPVDGDDAEDLQEIFSAGAVSAIAMPVFFRNEVVAVLSFFTQTQLEQKEWISFINQLLYQLGPEIERKKAAEELDRFSELSPDMLCVVGLEDGLFKKVNKACYDMLGYSPDELLTKTYRELLHPDDHNALKNVISKLKDNEFVGYFENRFLCKDGEYKWLAWTAQPYNNDNTVYASAKDIDTIKEANEAIRKSALKLYTIIESISDGFCTVDTNWEFTYINKEFEIVTPFKREDLLGTKVWEVFPRLLGKDFYRHFQKAVNTQHAQHFETYVKKFDAWYAITAYPSEEGLSVYLRNITDTKKLQLMLEVERKVLELSAGSDNKLSDVIDYFLMEIEENFQGMRCAVVRSRTKKAALKCIAAPNLPTEYAQAINETKEGETDNRAVFFDNQVHFETGSNKSSPTGLSRWLEEDAGLQAAWYFPVEASNNKVLATFVVYHKEDREPSPDELEVLNRARGIMGLLIEKQLAEQALRKSHTKLRKLTSFVQNARENELKYLAREIHDELGQVLTALKIDITLLYKRLEDVSNQPALDEVRNSIAEIKDVVDESIFSVRRIVRDLRPVVLDDLGLLSEIETRVQEFSRKMNIEVSLVSKVDKLQLGQEKATEVFRIFQETLTNIQRHSEASSVIVQISYNKSNELEIEVIDNGKGFLLLQKGKQAFGLLGMHERALTIGGKLNIKSVPGKGTTVTLKVPVNV